MADQALGKSKAHGAGHIMSGRVLLMVWASLMVLTVLTVGAVTVDFGPRVNLFIAMAIATAKASLVVLFFMHLLYDRKFYLLIFMTALVFVFMFVSMIMLDSTSYQADVTAREDAVQQSP